MWRNKDIPSWVGFAAFLVLLFVVLPSTGMAFKRFTLVFFFLWIACPILAWWLRSPALNESLTLHGYSVIRKVLVATAVAISVLFFLHRDFLRDEIGYRYLDGYSVSYYEDTGDWGEPRWSSDATATGFSSKAILQLYEAVLLVMSVGLPFSTWKVASKSVNEAEKRKEESINRTDFGEE